MSHRSSRGSASVARREEEQKQATVHSTPHTSDSDAEADANATRNDSASAATMVGATCTATAVLALYLSTVYPSVTGGDSGELTVTACNLGIAHPPGYPTYSMLGWAWLQAMGVIAPLAQKAYLMNCMCAAFGAAAAGVVAWTTAELASSQERTSWSRLRSATVGIYAGVCFAAMPTVWLYSIQGEVFALNNLLCAVLIALTVRYFRAEEALRQTRQKIATSKKAGEAKKANVSTSQPAAHPMSSLSPRTLVLLAYLGAFLCGVALTNQHTTVFPVLVTSAFVTWSLRSNSLLTASRILRLVVCVLCGMSPYAYLFIRSQWRVMDSWGDQRTLSGFLIHLLRREYGTFQLAASEISVDPGMMSRLAVYAANMRAEMMIITPLLAVIGVFAALRDESSATRRSALVMALSYVFYVVVFHKLANLDLRPLFLGVQARFWQQANMHVLIFSGIGVKYMADRAQQIVARYSNGGPRRSSDRSSASTSMSASRLSGMLTLIYTLAFTVAQVGLQYPMHDHHANDSFSVQGRAMLDSFPPNSIVLLNGDLNNNLAKYAQQCEGARPDVSLISLQLMSWDWFVPMQRDNYPNVTFPGNRYHVSTPGSFHIRAFLDANTRNKKAKGGIFLCGPFKDGDHSNKRTKAPDTNWYEEHPFGLCNQLLPHGTKPQNLTDFLRRGYSGLPSTDSLPQFASWKYGPETWELVLYHDNLQRLSYLTSYASFYSNQHAGDTDLLRLAYELTEEMRRQEALLTHFGMMGEHEYRSAGVIYGMWAQHLAASGDLDASDAVARQLYRAWSQYDQRHPNDPEIVPSLRKRVNPYSGRSIMGLDNEQARAYATAHDQPSRTTAHADSATQTQSAETKPKKKAATKTKKARN